MTTNDTPGPAAGHPAGAPDVLRYTAFSTDPDGGNPAGVVLDAAGLDEERMRAVAAEVGYSETAFLLPPPPDLAAPPGRGFGVRYFSPLAEVPFCGHATVAAAVALAERTGPGDLLFATPAGTVPVTVAAGPGGALRATLTSVEPYVAEAAPADLAEALAALDWRADELDPALPARIAFAGARHLVLAAATRQRLAALEYDFERLRALMLRLDLTTVQLVWREPGAGPEAGRQTGTVFHVRDPFPVGGVVEDPATGAAAAALGGYLRALGLVTVTAPVTLTLHQGHDMGRPGLLEVELRPDDVRVRVSGTAARIG
ncbi:PhzF family phenazine biosynthesis isomerase [Streptomyces sp. TRM 70361]|uniref:PhzF family phenazine biosynthesis protein n=1 Tax=Streptomyces sp. TRM 70361 TaxID=3116553 RepID=UPI002E7AAF68|nr:PhzF family phenazine biosynthesis isomerase [Streptomyces sp. TRM 70361]MEE1939871.1 PhzF family phenazine biosynthesis isomerase [Streptomyces sp. TRM 70361]